MAGYTYSFDSQLMQHYSPDSFHSNSKSISAVYDENQHPMVFSITDGTARLALTIADANTGQNTTIDLSSVFGLQRRIDHVTAFQDDAQNIYLAFTEEFTGTWNSVYNIYICAGAKPAVWRNADALPKLLLIPEVLGQMPVKVIDLFFTPCASAGTFFHDSNYPLLAAEFDRAWGDKPTVQRVKVNYQTNKWAFVFDELTIPTGAISVIDKVILSPWTNSVCLAALIKDASSGLFWMNMSFHNTTTGVKKTSVFTSNMFPQDIRCLAAIRNGSADKTNDLLLGGDALYWYPAEEYRSTNLIAPKRLTTPGDIFWKGVKEMVTAQNGTHVALWTQVGGQMICSAGLWYNSAYLMMLQPAVPVHSGIVRDLAPVFRSDDQYTGHHLLFLNEFGQHILLQYKPLNSVWEEQQWVISDPSLETPDAHFSSIAAYNSHIVVRNDQGYLAGNTNFSISSSDTVTVSVNGTRMVVGPIARDIQTNAQGALSLVSPIDSLGSSSIFQLWRSQKAIGGVINPATNISLKLGQVNGDNLKAQTLQAAAPGGDAGKPLIQKGADQDVKTAGNAISALHKQMAVQNPDGSLPTGPQAVSIFGDAWNAWHYVEKTAARPDKFIFQAEKLVSMEISVVGNMVTFEVNSVARALKAITFFLKQFAVDIDRIVNWIGFLFEWKTILKIHQDIKATTQATFNQVTVWSKTFVADIDAALGNGNAMFDTMLEQMRGKILQSNGDASNFYTTMQKGAQKQTSDPKKICPPVTHDGLDSTSTSPGSQWSSNQMMSGNIIPMTSQSSTNTKFILAKRKHGGSSLKQREVTISVEGSGLCQTEVIFENMLAQPQKAVSCVSDDAQLMLVIGSFWDDIQPFLADAENTINQLIKNISDVISKPENIGTDLINTMVDFGEGILKTVKDLFEAFLKYAASMVEGVLQEVFAADLQIPFLSALWKKCTGGDLPGILDLYCILIAIPTAVVGKLVTADASFWPDLSQWSKNFAKIDVSKSNPSAAMDHLKTLLEGSVIRDDGTYQAVNGTSQASNSMEIDGTGDYLRASIICHPLATLAEMLSHLVNAVLKKIPFPDILRWEADAFQWVGESVATVFSFPNVTDLSKGGLLMGSGIGELTAFIARLIEVIAAGAFAVLRKNDKTVPVPVSVSFSLACTGAEVLSLLTSCILRAIALDGDPDGIEAIANYIALANVLSSLVSQVSADIAEITDDAEFDAGAAVASVVDSALDLGRGILEWKTGNTEKHHVVTY